MLNFYSNTYQLLFLVLFWPFLTSTAQDTTQLAPMPKTIKQNRFGSQFLPYFIDDIYIAGGLNQSGLYYSNHHRNLNFSGGFQLYLESYLPLMRKAFVHYGFGYAQRRFNHSITHNEERTTHQVINHFIEVPLYVAYEIPMFSKVDTRFFVGTQLNFRAGSKLRNDYELDLPETQYRFNPNQFKWFDAGFLFGLSAEYKDIFMRFKGYFGANNLQTPDTGMFSAVYIDFGYFFLRGLRKKGKK